MKSVLIIANMSRNKPEEVNYHSVYVEGKLPEIGREIITWGESSWWPPKSQMHFEKLTDGEVHLGTKYEQRVQLPCGPRWMVAVTNLVPAQEIERTFLNGLFSGKETVRVEPHAEGGIVHYRMQFQVNGPVNSILWKLFFKKMHDENIKMILKSLKEHFEINSKVKSS